MLVTAPELGLTIDAVSRLPARTVWGLCVRLDLLRRQQARAGRIAAFHRGR